MPFHFFVRRGTVAPSAKKMPLRRPFAAGFSGAVANQYSARARAGESSGPSASSPLRCVFVSIADEAAEISSFFAVASSSKPAAAFSSSESFFHRRPSSLPTSPIVASGFSARTLARSELAKKM